MKTVLVCGDRKWDNRPLMEAVLSKIPLDKYDTLIHGDCRGADKMAGEIAQEMGFHVIAYPAFKDVDWIKYGKACGPIRNKKMLEEGKPHLVIAFHNDLAGSKGTKNMVKIAMEEDMEGDRRIDIICINDRDDYMDLEIK
jgi:hypothetical protein